jgi:ArsR family transcriptional regulator
MPMRLSTIQDLVGVAKCLSDPNRLRIVEALRQGELCVCELCDALGLSQSTLSTHLSVIRRAGIVRSRKEGKWSYYALTPRAVTVFDHWFQPFRAQIRQDAVLATDRKQLRQRLGLRRSGVCCVGFTCSKATSRRRAE